MPGLITNYILGERCYQTLSHNYLKDSIKRNPNAYRMGLQGPDVFYYDLSPRARKNPNNICHVVHSLNTVLFFDNLLEYTVILEGEERDICQAYIAGFLCHYAQDVNLNPYLQYRALKDSIEHPQLNDTPLYFKKLETQMDVLLLKNMNHMEPSQLNLEALVCLTKKERHIISDCLLYALRTTYHYRLRKPAVLSAFQSIQRTCIFIQEQMALQQKIHGIRGILSRIHKLSDTRFNFIYPEYNGDPRDYLNESHTHWFVPDTNDEKTESVFDLVEEAVIYSTQLLEAYDDYLAWNGNRDHLDCIISAKSYYTGHDLHDIPKDALSEMFYLD